MAYMKCSGGGGLKETLLWTNPNIDSPIALGDKEFTFTIGLSGFDYFKCIYAESKDRHTSEYRHTAIWLMNDLINGTNKTSQPAITGSNGTSYVFTRRLVAKSNTSINMSTSYSTSGSSNNNYAIPLYWYGLKGTIS